METSKTSADTGMTSTLSYQNSQESSWAELAGILGIRGRQAGSQLVARCPLHRDQHPSFSMNTLTGLWTCFSGCGSGNFHHLVMKLMSVSLSEAHDWVLSNRAPLLTPVEHPYLYNARPTLALPAWRLSFESLNRDVMPMWWFERGFTWETAEAWDVRYNQRDSKLVIPFYNCNTPGPLLAQHVVLRGTVTRNLATGPKYVNSPGLPRSTCLYGLAQGSGPLILVVEGALDALWLWQGGGHAPPTAALLGLTMHEEHLRIMRNFTEVCLALDNDEPGRVAITKIADMLHRNGRTHSQVTRLHLPPGRKDVGECTATELRQAIRTRKEV